MSLRSRRAEQLRADYQLLYYIFIAMLIYALIISSLSFVTSRSQKVEEQFAQFSVIALPPPPPVINEALEDVPPPEVEDFDVEDLTQEPLDDISEAAIGEEGAAEELMVEEKIASALDKPIEEFKSPTPEILPTREKTDLPMKRKPKPRSLINQRGASKPGGSAIRGKGAPSGTGSKSFGRGEFGMGKGGGGLFGSRTGFGRGKGTVGVTGRKSKKSIRIIVNAFVLADGRVDIAEYAGAIGVEDMESSELQYIIDEAVNQIKTKQYEPSNDPLRKIIEEVDFSYMGSEM